MGSSTPVTVRRVAAALIGVAGLIHLALVPMHVEESYLGESFLLSFLACSLIAYVLWRSDDALAWVAGVGVSLGMIACFYLARTVGLPGFLGMPGVLEKPDELARVGLFSIITEGLFGAIGVYALIRIRARSLAVSRASDIDSARG